VSLYQYFKDCEIRKAGPEASPPSPYHKLLKIRLGALNINKHISHKLSPVSYFIEPMIIVQKSEIKDPVYGYGSRAQALGFS